MISVITCSINPARFQATAAMYRQLLGSDHELIGIHDAKSLAEGYNRGISRSRGEILVFAHDDIQILTPHFAPRLHAHLARCDLLGVAGTTLAHSACWITSGPPFIHGLVTEPAKNGTYLVGVFGVYRPLTLGIQQLDGVFMACRREVVDKVQFDAATFDGFHGYDVDFSFACHRLGFRVGVCTDLPLIHASSGNFDDVWRGYALKYQTKYAGQLASRQPCPNQYTVVQAANPAQVHEIMERFAANVRDTEPARPLPAAPTPVPTVSASGPMWSFP